MRAPSEKKKTIEEYYDEELRYLDEAGREFAEAHPQRAGFLKITQRDDRDPYVERLFEGFAFLTGRVRQKLDDELPELTQSLLGLLWPHFLRPIPSLSILEFYTTPGHIQEPCIIQRGTEVTSQPRPGVPICRFQTCYDVHIRPLTLTEVALEGNSIIRFRFRIDGGVDYSRLFNMAGEGDYQRRCRRSIRLFIHDVDQPTASALHLYLTRYVQKVIIQPTPMQSDASDSAVILQGQEGIQTVGFSPEEGLVPDMGHSFSGYRLLQEYFAYPKKFFFIDLFGLEQLHPAQEVESFEVQLYFQKPFPADKLFTKANFHLHCTPIVNLLPTEIKPKTINYEATHYKIEAPEGCEVYSVDKVKGIVNSTMEERIYLPFYSFKHSRAADSGLAQSDRYYHTTTRLAIQRSDTGRPETSQDTYLTIIGPDSEVNNLKEETLSIKVTCTNGMWGHKLGESDICNRTSNSGVPEFVRFKNLNQPTLILYPPLQSGLEWRFISHLALNYLSLTDAEALQGILELYNWSGERRDREANRRRISSIRNVTARPQDIPYQGSVIRGIEVALEILKENFSSDEGDIHLFGLVMKEFLELYSTINSFVQLTILSYETKEELFKWTPKIMNDKNREYLMRRRHLPL